MKVSSSTKNTTKRQVLKYVKNFFHESEVLCACVCSKWFLFLNRIVVHSLVNPTPSKILIMLKACITCK